MRKIILLICVLIYISPAIAGGYKKIGIDKHKIYRYDFDLSSSTLELTRALDDGKFALENVLTCSRRHASDAAFNGGFYHEGYGRSGVPVWLMINSSNVFAIKSNQFALYITKDNEIKFDKLKTNIFLQSDRNKKIEISSINNPAPSGIKLFTQNYWTSTLSNPGTFEIIVENNIISSINHNGNNKIPHDGFVISANNSKNLQELSRLQVGEKLSYNLSISAGKKQLDLSKISTVMSGSDMLLKDSKIPTNITSKENSSPFRDAPHGRTAICQFDETKYAVYVADHNPAKNIYEITIRDIIIPLKKAGLDRETAMKMRLEELIQKYQTIEAREDFSIGMLLGDFAKFLKQEGCKNVINLDGGGSATLVVENKVINTPSGLQNINIEGKNLRNVGDIFLIKKKK